MCAMSVNYDTFARLYDADFASYDEDIGFLAELARRTGGPILELMCGTGRALLPLGEDGFEITGVDNSADMLAIAREKVSAAKLDQQVTLLQEDVRTATLPTGFMLAFITANSFMHMETVEDQLAALQAIRPTLQYEGLLVIDLFNPNLHELIQHDGHTVLANTFDLDGDQVNKFVSTSTDLATQTNYVTFIYDRTDAEGRLFRRTMPFAMRWLYRYELEHLLVRAGYEIEAFFGSYFLDDYTSTSERLIAVAHVK